MFKNQTFFWSNLLPEPHLLHSALDWAHIPQSDDISALTAHGLKISWDLRGEMSAKSVTVRRAACQCLAYKSVEIYCTLTPRCTALSEDINWSHTDYASVIIKQRSLSVPDWHKGYWGSQHSCSESSIFRHNRVSFLKTDNIYCQNYFCSITII